MRLRAGQKIARLRRVNIWQRKHIMIEGVANDSMRIIPVNGGPIRQTVGATIVDDYHIPKNWWVLPISRMNMTLYHNIH